MSGLDGHPVWRPGAPPFQGWGTLVLAAALTVCLGCQQPEGRPRSTPEPFAHREKGLELKPAVIIDPTKVETRDDIVAVIQYWPPVPWLKNADGGVVGFRVPVYFQSAETELGAFVPGRILVWLYELQRTPDGSRTRELVHGWQLDQRDALGFRVRKRSLGGYYYGLVLTWPPDVQVSGRVVEIVIGYERKDGHVVTSAPRRFQVPVSDDFRQTHRTSG